MQHLFKTSISKKSLWFLKNYSSSDIVFKKIVTEWLYGFVRKVLS